MKTVEKIYVVGIPNTELSFNPVSTYQDANEIWIFPITQHEKECPEDYLSADAISYCRQNDIPIVFRDITILRHHPGDTVKRFCDRYSRESILCDVASQEVAELAARKGITRALAAVELHRKELEGCIFLCGNAPLALAGMIRMIVEEGIRPALMVGMPVGFVNVEAAKELILETDVPHIVNRGRKGGSNVAAAIVNAILYELGR